MRPLSPETMLLLASISGVIFGLLGHNAGKKRTIGGPAGAVLGFLMGLLGFIIVCCFAKNEVLENEYYEYEEPASESEPLSATDEIEKLKRLLDTGAITREEFNIQKSKIFGR